MKGGEREREALVLTFVYAIHIYPIHLYIYIHISTASVLASGACHQLKYFNLGWNALGDQGVELLANALLEGQCPLLEKVGLCYVKMGEKGAAKIADVLDARVCPRLQHVQMTGNNGASGPLGIIKVHQALGRKYAKGTASAGGGGANGTCNAL